MTTLVTAHRLYVLASCLFVGLGCFVLIHPELERGASLILLGLAALERGSRRTRRLFKSISRTLGDDSDSRRGGRGKTVVRPPTPIPRPDYAAPMLPCLEPTPRR